MMSNTEDDCPCAAAAAALPAGSAYCLGPPSKPKSNNGPHLAAGQGRFVVGQVKRACSCRSVAIPIYSSLTLVPTFNRPCSWLAWCQFCSRLSKGIWPLITFFGPCTGEQRTLTESLTTNTKIQDFPKRVLSADAVCVCVNRSSRELARSVGSGVQEAFLQRLLQILVTHLRLFRREDAFVTPKLRGEAAA